jgi:hypothetical protein
MVGSVSKCTRIFLVALATRSQALRGPSEQCPIPATQQQQRTIDHIIVGAHNLPNKLVAMQEAFSSRNKGENLMVIPFLRLKISAVS